MGAAKVPLAYVLVRADIESAIYVFEDEDEERIYQMPLNSKNFKRESWFKIFFNLRALRQMLGPGFQDHNKLSNGRKFWLTLVGHYDGTGELNKRLEDAKEEISRLQYKDKRHFCSSVSSPN